MAILVTGGAATGLAYEVEDPRAAHDFLERGALDTASDFGNVYGSLLFLGPASISAWSLGNAYDNERLRDTGRDMTEALLVSQFLVVPIKLAVDRQRPDGDRYSFPSGHTANAVSVVPILWRSYGAKVGIVASGLALCTALGRQEAERHYLSDVIGGATIGFLVGDTIARRSSHRSSFTRHIAATGDGLALTWKW
jgi:membrane-associated phospholipid phosphatase